MTKELYELLDKIGDTEIERTIKEGDPTQTSALLRRALMNMD